jgi:hypothetical protein
MGGRQGLRGWSCKGSTSSSPNSLYPDLVGDMQRKTEKEQTALIPLIQTYAGTQKNTDININTRDAAEIKLHFINIKELKYAYIQNGNKLARVMVAYL